MTAQESGLAVRLREATSAEHRNTETRSFVTQLMEGALDLEAYARYLAQYAYVYRALESRKPRPTDPSFINDPALARFPSITSDLVNLGVEDWEASQPALPATQAYVDRLTSLGSTDVPRYVAHHYTRYLGDLSGGQSIAKRVARLYDATDDQLSFYRFDDIDRPGAYKIAYRDALNNLELTEDEEAALISEAKAAFGYNAAMFDSLNEVTTAAG